MYVALRRAWLLVIVVLFLSVACARAAWGATPASYSTVTVRSGDTVWSIAAARYPGADTREKVGEILEANGLGDALLTPGQHLRVPNS
jgi:nucleoid-associated protein YgaU